MVGIIIANSAIGRAATQHHLTDSTDGKMTMTEHNDRPDLLPLSPNPGKIPGPSSHLDNHAAKLLEPP